MGGLQHTADGLGLEACVAWNRFIGAEKYFGDTVSSGADTNRHFEVVFGVGYQSKAGNSKPQKLARKWNGCLKSVSVCI